jgi:hypothetical protein
LTPHTLHKIERARERKYVQKYSELPPTYNLSQPENIHEQEKEEALPLKQRKNTREV